jgi:hypothetical protein
MNSWNRKALPIEASGVAICLCPFGTSPKGSSGGGNCVVWGRREDIKLLIFSCRQTEVRQSKAE